MKEKVKEYKTSKNPLWLKVIVRLIISGTAGQGIFWMYQSMNIFSITFNIFIATVFSAAVMLYLWK